MPFEQVTLITPDGQRHGPVDWPTMQRWAAEGRIAPGMTLLDDQTGEQRTAGSFPDLGSLHAPVPAGDGPASVIIPYKNPPALIGYYLGVFSLASCIPFLGFIGIGMAVAAVILGRKGLKRVRENPECRGTAHAWIAIVCGSLFGLVGLAFNVIAIIGILSSR